MTDDADENVRRDRLTILFLLAIGILPFELNGWYNPLLAQKPWKFWVVEVATWIVSPVVLVVAGLKLRAFNLADIGLHNRIAGRRNPYLLAPLILTCVYLFYHLDYWAVMQGRVWFPRKVGDVTFSYEMMVPPAGPTTGWFRLLALLHLSLTAGFVEEILYRGMSSLLFPRGWIGGAGFVISSTLVFASAHWEGAMPVLWEATVFGLAASVFYRLTHNLWPLIAAHVAIDFLWLMS